MQASKPEMSVDMGGSFEQKREPRDWKKLALVAGLGILSWVATYVGMLELIEANMGELPLVHKLIVAFSVAMLMTMIIWLLDQIFAPNGFFTKILYAAGYVFLSIISIGFGFGFYWKVLESKSEATRGAESAITQVQSALHGASTRLEQLQSTLVQLTAISNTKAEIERTQGTSCPNSKPGDGPRRKLREDDAMRFQFATEFVKGRTTQVKGEIGALDGELAKVIKGDASTVDAKTGTRNDFMKSVGRKLDLTVTGFNAFRTDPQLKQMRADLAERADKTQFIDTRGQPYSCPDPQLAGAIKGVVRAIDQLPELEKPKIVAVEGSEATIEAFRRLTATFYGLLSFKLPPSSDELRDMQQKAIQSVETAAKPVVVRAQEAGLSKRDYVPLAVAIFVDICLLLVSMGRPVNRLGGMVTKMRSAEEGPVIQILSRFNEIHRDQQVRENFEVFRHIVFDFNGDYYAAVPLIAPYRRNAKGEKVAYSTRDIEDMTQEAHLLSNLFTSFEKEKMFTRVYNPLLSTRTIQQRLWKQGSKFAQAESFRLYKFKDGAWSEIILGAIMGAAKRVESEKRRRRVEEQIFAEHTPSLGAPKMPDFSPPPGLSMTQSLSAAAVTAATASAQAPAIETAAVQPEQAFAPAAAIAPELDPRIIAAVTAAVRNAMPELHTQRPNAQPVFEQAWQQPQAYQPQPYAPYPAYAPAQAYAPTHETAPEQAFADHSNVELHPAFARGAQRLAEMTRGAPSNAPAQGYAPSPSYPQAQPYAPFPGPQAYAQPYANHAHQPVEPMANNNTAPHMRAAAGAEYAAFAPMPQPAAQPSPMSQAYPEPVYEAPVAAPSAAPVARLAEWPSALSRPVAAPAEQTIEIEARRETITYRIPISEASLPAGLFKAASAAAASMHVIDAESAPVAHVRAAPPPPAPVLAGSVLAALAPPSAPPAVTQPTVTLEPEVTEAEIEIVSIEHDELDPHTQKIAGKFGPAQRS